MDWMNKEQQKAALILVVAFIGSALTVNGTLTAAEEKYSTILSAVRTNETIIIDGQLKESSWNETKTLIIPVVDGKVGDVDVEMKALYDTDYIYMYIVWPDPTQSDALFWGYNGTAWNPPNKNTEDIFTIFWNIRDSVEGYDIAGCAITCHANRMHTNTPEERLDYWKWKAEKGNPSGYMWDGFLDDIVVIGEKIYPGFSRTFMIEKAWHSHKLDETSGDYVEERKNAIIDERGNFIGPRYYEPDARGEDAKHITMEEILRDEAVEFLNLTKLNDGREISIGFKVPVYISEKPTGSARDISAKGVYYDGKWHLEFKRKLQTGHDDDVLFDIAKTYRFSIAVNDDSHGSANEGYGQGHSISMLARTLEFGGIGSEEITQLALIRDYLQTAKAYTGRGESGMALSEVDHALAIFNAIRGAVADEDPELYMDIRKRFVEAKRNPSIDNLDVVLQGIEVATLTLQGKREPPEAPWNVKLLVLWGSVQLYVFVFISIFVLYPLYKTIQTTRIPEMRYFGIFLFIVILPLFLEGVGRFGVLFKIRFLQNFSFTTNEYITLLWAIGMFIALLIAKVGFTEIDETIRSLKYYSAEVETKMEELRKSQEQLVKSERMASIGQLAASVGHELRNPLGVIKNVSYYLSMALAEKDEKVKKHLNILERELDTSNKIITDLLDFSRGEIEPTFGEANINAILKDTLARASVPDNVKVETYLADLPSMRVDGEQLQRVFLNMISNAVHAMPDGGKLIIRTKSKGNSVEIEFEDTGKGISKEDIKKIFEPLFTTKAKGIGLGLAICKQIIDGHGGTIDAVSAVDQGATFIIKLPVMEVEEDEEKEN
ncbi:MAG: ethylbenzene dehydrogenase-related protein [Candidatus Hydrothermarchaeales archaeon]